MSQLKQYEDKYVVKLNIYDMTPFNRHSEKIGLGVYHSGLEVFGSEYSFGGHPGNFSGVFSVSPRCAGQEIHKLFEFKQTVLIGYTFRKETDLSQLLDSLGNNRFQGNKYNLFYNNCNHFTNDLAMLLCGEPIPSWVNRLARISSRIPFLDLILPHQMMNPSLNMNLCDFYEDITHFRRSFIV